MAETILSFKLEITEDEIISHAGLATFGEFMHGIKMEDLIASLTWSQKWKRIQAIKVCNPTAFDVTWRHRDVRGHKRDQE